MPGTTDLGQVEFQRLDDGRTVVVRADDVIGVSVELLAQTGVMLCVDDGDLLLAGYPEYRYRPVGFHTFYRGCAPTVLVCERVRG